MSKIDELIKEMCPNGVEYRKVGDIADYEQPSKYLVKSTNYNDDFATPVLTAGQTFILGYTNETDGIYPASKDKPVIIFDDFTGAFKWVDFPFKAKSSAIKMITAKENVLIRYLYHLMGFLNYSSDEHKRLWISTYSEFKLPIPPLPIQREIARILDNFTELTKELTKELTARKKQYEFYRDELLKFDNDMQMVKLGELCKITRGIRVTRSELNSDSGYPVYQNSLTPMGYYNKPNRKANTSFIISAGAAGEIGYSNEDYWAADDCLTFECPSSLNDRFLYHFFKTKQEYLYSRVRKASIPRLSREVLEKLEIPFLPIEIQNQLVSVLDNFDAICSDLNIGLPAEIEARQKQYEYYRDMLLTFAEKGEIIPDRQTDRQAIIRLIQYVFGYVPVKLEDVCQKVSSINWKKENNTKAYIDLTSVSRDNHCIIGEDVTTVNSNNAPSRAKQIINKNDILFGGTRPMLKRFCIVTDEYDNQVCSTGYSVLRIDNHLALTNYIYHVIGTTDFYSYIEANQQGTSYPAISDKILKQYEFALPTIEEQNRIVSILDRFDSLCNDISSGLPAEIEARKKQYEYYRNKLLTFEKS